MESRLRPVERLQTSSEFRRVFQQGRRVSTAALRIHYLPTSGGPTSSGFSRLGLVVSRRNGKAHVRNRIKRLLREVFRHQKHRLPRSYDVVMIPRGLQSQTAYANCFETLVKTLKDGGEDGTKDGRRERRPDSNRKRRARKASGSR